jgi:hypothetical protein
MDDFQTRETPEHEPQPQKTIPKSTPLVQKRCPSKAKDTGEVEVQGDQRRILNNVKQLLERRNDPKERQHSYVPE